MTFELGNKYEINGYILTFCKNEADEKYGEEEYYFFGFEEYGMYEMVYELEEVLANGYEVYEYKEI